jgi:hypothetical protein
LRNQIFLILCNFQHVVDSQADMTMFGKEINIVDGGELGKGKGNDHIL